jgi:hypothetical protein
MDEPAARGPRDRHAYGMAVAVALLTGAVAVVCAVVLGLPLRDPDGFLGPTYVRLPLIAVLLLALDVLTRVLVRVRSPRAVPAEILSVVRERWPWRRLRPVLVGLVAFYVTYVAYRNLKHYLPLLRPGLVDDELAGTDRALTGGVAPAEVLHDLLGTGIAAHVLSWFYLAFLIFVPASLGLALVLRGRAGHACWYVTALCLNWALGTASYYVLPSRGPIYAEPELFSDLPETGVSRLQDSLLLSRLIVLGDPQGTERLNSIAAFASLHVSIIFTAALIGQFALGSIAVRAALWGFFGLTVVATIYFGWHYLLDDVAGLAIGAISVLLAAWGTGQFRGRRKPVRGPDESGVAGARERRRSLRRHPQAAPSPLTAGGGPASRTEADQVAG